MWVYLALIGAALFALAGILSPIVWFLAPAVALFAIAMVALLGGQGAAQEAGQVDPDAGPGQRAVMGSAAGQVEDPDTDRPTHVDTGHAHEGQRTAAP